MCGHSCSRSSTDVIEKVPSVLYTWAHPCGLEDLWGGSEWDAAVCLHLRDFSLMIPICVHCSVVCVCPCTRTGTAGSPRGNKHVFEECRGVMKGTGGCLLSS